MQSGIGLSKILILAGAGYTSTILIKNGKMSDLLGELQSLMKGLEKSGDDASVDHSDAIAAQVRRLAMEVKQLALSRQVTILNQGSGRIGNITPLIIPAATLGAVGYGYMWWKGLSFSDLMYVTKRNMANAVTNLTKHLESVSEALAAAKRHLTQRIENLDGKMDDQHEMSKLIMNNVNNVQTNLGAIEKDLGSLQDMVYGLEGKMDSLEAKQNFANAGVGYLCNIVDGKKEKMPEILREQLQLSGRSRGFLTAPDSASLKGLKHIAESLMSETTNTPAWDVVSQDGIERLDNQPKTLLRAASTTC